MCDCLICKFIKRALRSLQRQKLTFRLFKVLRWTERASLQNIQIAITIPVSYGDVVEAEAAHWHPEAV